MSWLYLTECDEMYKSYIGGLPGNKPDEAGYKSGWRDAMKFLGGQSPRTEEQDKRLLQAQEHAIACGNLTLEIQSALGMLTNACEEAGWPKTAEQMAPMNMARSALKKRLETTVSPQQEKT